MGERNEIEALAQAIFDAHREQYVGRARWHIPGWEEVEQSTRDHWIAIARRLQPARVPVAYRLHTGEPRRKWQWMDGLPSTGSIREAALHGWEIEYAYSAAAPAPEAEAGKADPVATAVVSHSIKTVSVGWVTVLELRTDRLPDGTKLYTHPAPEPAEAEKIDSGGCAPPVVAGIKPDTPKPDSPVPMNAEDA